MTLENSPRSPSSTPAEEAAEWLIVLQGEHVPLASRERFEAWRAQSSENAEVFSRMAAIWQSTDAIAAVPDMLAVRHAALAAPSRPRRYWRFALAAASILAVTSFGADMAFHDSRLAQLLTSTGLGSFVSPDHGEFATAVGERSTIMLNDGSVLTLDTNSAARVAYTSTERGITLLRGQALFDVAKHRPIPFVVHAGDRRIVATGTSFDVRLDKTAVEVTLLEGHVVVAQTALSRTEAARAATELQPGEKLIAPRDAPVTVAVADISHVTDWRDGRLTFVDRPLVDAISEVNRYSETHVVLADGKLGTLHLNGMFRAGQPAEFAQALTRIYPVTVHATGDGSLIVAWKNRP